MPIQTAINDDEFFEFSKPGATDLHIPENALKYLKLPNFKNFNPIKNIG